MTKFSQPRASISLKRASAAPRSRLCYVIPFFLYTNNIQKYYSVSRLVISIIIVIAPTSYNDLLQGSLPEFLPNGSLRSLLLSGTNFSGALPDTIGNLRRLSKIDLSMCNFNGSIPYSMANLTQLIYLGCHTTNSTDRFHHSAWPRI